jgi:hypothetical protein
MLPNQLQLGRSFVRTIIISAIIASLFAAGCGSAYNAQPAPTQAPTITQQPTNQTVAAGATATFTAMASGNPAPTVQWQVSTDGGATFSNVSGATSTTLMLSTVTVALNNYQYRAVFTNSVGSVNSTAATLTVTGGSTITSATSTTFAVGVAGTFTVTAAGTPAPTLSESGTLPSGVTFTPSTGILSGTPLAGTGAAYPITFTAHNGVGADATQSFTLNVNEAPSFASANMTNFTVGVSGTFTIITMGFPVPTFSETGALPNGVTLTTAGLLSGAPTVSGTFPITITAHNGVGVDAMQSFTLTVDTAPAITSANSTTFTVGTLGTFTVTATGSPAPTFSETGMLPAGVTLDPATGVLSGIPTAGAGAIYFITLTASNGSGVDATQNFTLTVNEAPSFTSPSSTNFTVGTFGVFTVTASGFPAPTLSLTSGTLPSGVMFNASTGVLSGMTSTAGSFPLMFTAHNGIGTDAIQNFTLTVGTGPLTISTVEPFPIFAGTTTPITFNITVANDVAGDQLTASLTVDANTGLACTPTTCGNLASSTPTLVSLGNYTISYTPPPSPASFVQTYPTIMVTSLNQSGSIPANDSFEVDPAGILVTTDDTTNGANEASGRNRSQSLVQIGPTPTTITVTVKVYNDTANAGVTFLPLTGNGYACANIGTNKCGTLGMPTAPSGTPTTTTITYTPPSSLPSAPYNKPRIQAVSKADPTKSASIVFVLNSNPVTNLKFNYNTKFNSVLTGTAPTVQTVVAKLVGDAGSSKAINWALTANGTPCSPTCGTLGTATTTVNPNGMTVRSVIAYTPPSSVPGPGQTQPTITATSADDPTQTDSFTFNIADGTCGSGHESLLNGQYAFLLRGGVASAGYSAFIGNFTADGTGKITGGLLDINSSSQSFLGLTILPTGSNAPPFDSKYSVGSDNRGCLTLSDSGHGTETFRFSVGKISGSGGSQVANEGRIIRFDDNTWRGRAQIGVFMKQNPTSFNLSALTGNYAYGEVGVDSNGGRFAGAGVVTSNGTGMFSNIIGDFNDAGTVSGPVTGGTGTYTVAANGRGTATTTLTILGKAQTSNLVLYMVSSSVSSSEVLFMTTGNPNTEAILSGELKKQTGPFSTAALSGNGFVLYASGVNPGNAGGNVTAVGQATFTGAPGNATVTIDENNNGTLKSNPSTSATFAVDVTGRMTVTGLGTTPPPIIYMIDSNSGFSVGTDNGVPFGYVERQSSSVFQTSSISGSFFFGGDAPTTGAQYQSGTASFNGNGGNISGKADDSGPNGLKTENISGLYSFSVASNPPGKGTVGSNSIAYAISVTKIVFMSTGASPEIFVGQR